MDARKESITSGPEQGKKDRMAVASLARWGLENLRGGAISQVNCAVEEPYGALDV